MDVAEQLKELSQQLNSLGDKFKNVTDGSYRDSIQNSVNRISKVVADLEALPLPAQAFGCLPESDDEDLDFDEDFGADEKLLGTPGESLVESAASQKLDHSEDRSRADDTGDETDASDATVNYDDKQSKVSSIFVLIVQFYKYK